MGERRWLDALVCPCEVRPESRDRVMYGVEGLFEGCMERGFVMKRLIEQ